MIQEFNWWLLLLGLVVGGGLTWLVMYETRRREEDLLEDELPDESLWLEARLADEGYTITPETIERVIQLHRSYLAVVMPEDPPDEWAADEYDGGGSLEVSLPEPAALPPPGPLGDAAAPGAAHDGAVHDETRTS